MTPTTRNPATHPNTKADGESIWFASPPGFTSLPLDVLLAPPSSPEGDRLREIVEPLLASAPDDGIRRQFAANLADVLRMFHVLSREGMVHCSLGLHRDDTGQGDGGGVLLSLFTIAWMGTAWGPRGVTAARAVASAEGHTHIDYAELPCGPATFSETVRTPTLESGLPGRPLLQIHAHLPHPDGTSLALLTLSTTAVVLRESYRLVLRQMAELVSFDDPFGQTSREHDEDGGPR